MLDKPSVVCYNRKKQRRYNMEVVACSGCGALFIKEDVEFYMQPYNQEKWAGHCKVCGEYIFEDVQVYLIAKKDTYNQED